MKREIPRIIFQYALGVVVVGGFFALLYLLVSKSIPPENKDLLNLVVGALLASFTTVVGYFYGSSAGSAQKTEMFKPKEEPKP